MDKSERLEATPKDDTQLREGIAAYLAEMTQLREQIQRDQLEIEASQKRTQAMLTQLKAR